MGHQTDILLLSGGKRLHGTWLVKQARIMSEFSGKAVPELFMQYMYSKAHDTIHNRYTLYR